MVGRNPEYAETEQEFWDKQVDSFQESELPEGQPAVYVGEERYDSVEEAAEDLGVEADTLRNVLYDREGGSITSSPEDFDRDPRIVDTERFIADPEKLAGVTMERPGNSVEWYDQESSEKREPHTEGPQYEKWVNGFEDEDALQAFSGLFEDQPVEEVSGHSQSEGDRAFGSGYDVGLQN